MAETGQSNEEKQAILSDCPCLYTSVLDDFRRTLMLYGQARLGENVIQSVVRSNLELKIIDTIATSFSGSLILPSPGVSEERPWHRLVTCHFDN